MEVETVSTDSLQVVSFSLVNESTKKKENYAVPIEQVREIRPLENITKIPKAKPYIKGVMNLRGMIIPIVDIKKRLGFGEINELDKNYRILVADVRDSVYGFIVDNVNQVIQITIKDIEPVSPDAFESHHYIKGIAKIEGKLIVLLDIIALLEDAEDLSNNDSNSIQENTTKSDDNNDDIPPELKEVFKEDENGIPTSDISR